MYARFDDCRSYNKAEMGLNARVDVKKHSIAKFKTVAVFDPGKGKSTYNVR